MKKSIWKKFYEREEGYVSKDALYKAQRERQRTQVSCDLCGKILSYGNIGHHRKKGCPQHSGFRPSMMVRDEEYYKKKKEALQIHVEKRKTPILCECGEMIKINYMNRHKLTAKHKKIVEWCERLPQPPEEWIKPKKKIKFNIKKVEAE